MSGEDTKPPPAAPIEAFGKIRVRVVDARLPFPTLAFFQLQSVPRPGDMISIQTGLNAFSSYKVEFVNFNPFAEFQVDLGCLPESVPSTATHGSETQRMDDVVKANTQMFDRAQAYTNALIVAGYAGAFAIWAFARSALTTHAVALVALLLGISLFLFISWEIYAMFVRANIANSFHQAVDATPADFFRRQAEHEKRQRAINTKFAHLWRLVFLPTVIMGYAGALLLMYNIFASLVTLPQWP